jgi:hypothetical protein
VIAGEKEYPCEPFNICRTARDYVVIGASMTALLSAVGLIAMFPGAIFRRLNKSRLREDRIKLERRTALRSRRH